MEGSQPTARMCAVPESPVAVPGSPVRGPRLRSPFARAAVPVLGGIVVIGLIFLGTWLVAMFISRGGADSTERLAPATFSAGSAEARAESIAEDGPILFPGLETTSGERTLVLDHEGDDPLQGWHLYWAYPKDRDPSCHVRQIEGTKTFIDCEDREVLVTELALPPRGVFPEIEDESITIDLRGAMQPSS